LITREIWKNYMPVYVCVCWLSVCMDECAIIKFVDLQTKRLTLIMAL